MKAIHTNRGLAMRVLNLATGKTFGKGAHVVEVPKPKFSQTEVLVKVSVVALNAIDHKYVDILSPINSRVGCDYAGIVQEVGVNAKGNWKIGDRIAGMVHGGVFQDKGAFAEYLVIDGDLAWHVPESVKDEEACTYGISATTAMLALNVHLEIPQLGQPLHSSDKKNSILIYSGSTAVGLFAIQLAKAVGYVVVTTASPKSQDLVKRYGADAVFDYRSPTAVNDIREQFPHITKALDCISEGSSSNFCSEVMRNNNGKVVLLLDNGKSKVPNVTYGNIVIFTSFGVSFEWLPPVGPKFPANEADRETLVHFYAMLPSILEHLKSPPVAWTENGGFDGIFQGLDSIRAGKVSGKKLVVKM